MASASVINGLSVLVSIVGLALLLYGTAIASNPILYGGGAVTLVGVGILTAFVAGLE